MASLVVHGKSAIDRCACAFSAPLFLVGWGGQWQSIPWMGACVSLVQWLQFFLQHLQPFFLGGCFTKMVQAQKEWVPILSFFPGSLNGLPAPPGKRGHPFILGHDQPFLKGQKEPLGSFLTNAEIWERDRFPLGKLHLAVSASTGSMKIREVLRRWLSVKERQLEVDSKTQATHWFCLAFSQTPTKTQEGAGPELKHTMRREP